MRTEHEYKNLEAERDAAWAELRQIRKAIGANPEESTLDGVRRVVAKGDALAARVVEMREALEGAVEYTALLDVFTRNAMRIALDTPNDSAVILARHDAAILLEAAEVVASVSQEASCQIAADALRARAAELGKAHE